MVLGLLMEHDEVAPHFPRKYGKLVRDMSIVTQDNGAARKLRRHDLVFPALIVRGMITVIDKKVYGLIKFPQAGDGIADKQFSDGGVRTRQEPTGPWIYIRAEIASRM